MAEIDTYVSSIYSLRRGRYEVILPQEDEEISQNSIHSMTLDFLVKELEPRFVNPDTGIYKRLYLFGGPETYNKPVYPDIMVIPNWPNLPSVYRASYRIGQDGPPPPVIFEVSSPGN